MARSECQSHTAIIRNTKNVRSLYTDIGNTSNAEAASRSNSLHDRKSSGGPKYQNFGYPHDSYGHCYARGKLSNKCNKQDHFARCCRSNKSSKNIRASRLTNTTIIQRVTNNRYRPIRNSRTVTIEENSGMFLCRSKIAHSIYSLTTPHMCQP